MNSPATEATFPGASFVSALDEYTKRIETSIAAVESTAESILTTALSVAFVLPVLTFLYPLISRFADETAGYSNSSRNLSQIVIVASVAAVLVLSVYVVYRRLVLLRRYRSNLFTLLWPYERLLQKLSQMLEQGNLDEGTSTLIELKLIEAEVAYGRATRLKRLRSPMSLLLGGGEPDLPDYDVRSRLRKKESEENWQKKL